MTNQERQAAIKRNQEIERRIAREATIETFFVGVVAFTLAIGATLVVMAAMASKL